MSKVRGTMKGAPSFFVAVINPSPSFPDGMGGARYRYRFTALRGQLRVSGGRRDVHERHKDVPRNVLSLFPSYRQDNAYTPFNSF